MAEHIVPRRIYVSIWGALIALTVVTALLSRVNLGAFSGPVALTIATFKALLVVLFFMHVRYERQKIVWLVILAGIFWLLLLFALSMTDYGTRGLLGIPGK